MRINSFILCPLDHLRHISHPWFVVQQCGYTPPCIASHSSRPLLFSLTFATGIPLPSYSISTRADKQGPRFLGSSVAWLLGLHCTASVNVEQENRCTTCHGHGVGDWMGGKHGARFITDYSPFSLPLHSLGVISPIVSDSMLLCQRLWPPPVTSVWYKRIHTPYPPLARCVRLARSSASLS